MKLPEGVKTLNYYNQDEITDNYDVNVYSLFYFIILSCIWGEKITLLIKCSIGRKVSLVIDML